MKRLIACAVLGLSLALPNVSFADRYYEHHDGPGHFLGGIVALPFVAGAAVIGAAATIATAPFYALDGGGYYRAPPPAPAYYAPPVSYYAPSYYAAPRVYYAPPVYAYRPVYPGYYHPRYYRSWR
jgi:hypothetical protein